MYDKKIALLREIFPDFRIRKGVEFVTKCPSLDCKKDPNHFSKKKLEINLETNTFACWRCHYSGHALKIVRQHGTASQKQRFSTLVGLKAAPAEVESKISLPKEFKFVLDHKATNKSGREAYEWLLRRGISEETILQNRIGFCDDGEYGGRIIFPSFDASCSLNYFVTRHLIKNDGFKWLKCKSKASSSIWNEFLIDWTRPIILTESVKTYLKFFQNDLNIISNNGTALSKRHALFTKILMDSSCDVVVAFDPGAKDVALFVAENLQKYDCQVRIASFDKQPDDLSLEEFLLEINRASSPNRTDILRERIMNL